MLCVRAATLRATIFTIVPAEAEEAATEEEEEEGVAAPVAARRGLFGAAAAAMSDSEEESSDEDDAAAQGWRRPFLDKKEFPELYRPDKPRPTTVLCQVRVQSSAAMTCCCDCSTSAFYRKPWS